MVKMPKKVRGSKLEGTGWLAHFWPKNKEKFKDDLFLRRETQKYFRAIEKKTTEELLDLLRNEAEKRQKGLRNIGVTSIGTLGIEIAGELAEMRYREIMSGGIFHELQKRRNTLTESQKAEIATIAYKGAFSLPLSLNYEYAERALARGVAKRILKRHKISGNIGKEFVQEAQLIGFCKALEKQMGVKHQHFEDLRAETATKAINAMGREKHGALLAELKRLLEKKE